MANQRAIKTKIRSVSKTHQVTKAMEAVSGVKMRKAQMAAITARPYAQAAFRILGRISGALDVSRHPLIVPREVEAEKKRVLAVVITSDKGLAGGLNASLLKQAMNYFKEEGISRDRVGLLAIGRKGEDYFTRRGYLLEEKIVSPGEESITENFNTVVSLVVDLYKRGEYDECVVIYTNFRSTFEQEPSVRTLLPLSVDNLETMIKGITPEKGKFADQKKSEDQKLTGADYLFEPSPESVFEKLIPRLIAIELHHAYLESKASEHSARMVAMRNASDKAKEVQFLLTREYNKARQSGITREMSEIIGGMESMK